MSKKDFDEIRIVNDVHSALASMSEYLGEHCAVQVSANAQKKWEALEKKQREFYDLSLEDRLVYSGMNKAKEQL